MTDEGSRTGPDDQHGGGDDGREESDATARDEPRGESGGWDEDDLERTDDTDDGWKFSLEDLEDGDDGDADEREVGPAGPEPNSTPVTPGSPSLENAAFVVLGMLAMSLVLVRLAAAGFAG